MPPSERFAQELAHLVWLLVYRPARVDDQKRVLRDLLLQCQQESRLVEHSSVALSVMEGALLENPSEETRWLSELSTRMAGHSVRAIEARAGARAAELLGVARALAGPVSRDDHGAAFDARLVALAPQTIAVRLGSDGFVRAPTPAAGSVAIPDRGRPGVRVDSLSGLKAYDGGEGVASMRPTPVHQMLAAEVMPAERPETVASRLDGAGTPEEARLDDATRSIEDAAQRGDWHAVLAIATKLQAREDSAADPALKRAIFLQLKHVARPNILRGLASLLVSHRELRGEVHAVLARLGEPAADVLVDLLVAAESSRDRRAYRDAVRACPDAVQPLQQFLSDHRWYVVRNAAELLGEMNAADADRALIGVLEHRDARVRQAATLALIRLGTPHAVHTIVKALGDRDAAMRLKAAQGMAQVKGPRAVPALLAALDDETEPEVQQALLASLGAQGTPEAIARLVQESTPGSLLRRRPVARRLAAAQALASLDAPEARRALQALQKDRDSSIRESVERLVREGQREVVSSRQ